MIVAIPNTAQQLMASLLLLRTESIGPGPNYAPIQVAPPVFFLDDHIKVSGEQDQHSVLWIDYYDEYMKGMCWIHSKLEAWAKEQGGHWEWQDPSCIVFYAN